MAMGLLRLHAAEWHIDPHEIGVLGFSAGGHLSAAISTHFDKRSYPAVDAADKESCRPDFAVAIYPVTCRLPQRYGMRSKAPKSLSSIIRCRPMGISR
jgi:acetyl esterase/lipase